MGASLHEAISSTLKCFPEPGSIVMIKNTLSSIENKIRRTKVLTEADRGELLRLLGSLKSEISNLAETKAEHAESISGFMERSTHEATRQEKNPTLLKLAIDGLSASVRGFEASYPKLVEDVNYICTVLARMGI
jgi:hypothetical protein